MTISLFEDPDALDEARLAAAGFKLVYGMWCDPADGARLLKAEALKRLDRREAAAREGKADG